MRAIQMLNPQMGAGVAANPGIPAFNQAQPQALPQPGAPQLGNDPQAVARNVVNVLHAALGSVRDPEHQAAYATALTSLTKLLASNEKEQHQALAGKLSPKLMARAYAQT